MRSKKTIKLMVKLFTETLEGDPQRTVPTGLLFNVTLRNGKSIDARLSHATKRTTGHSGESNISNKDFHSISSRVFSVILDWNISTTNSSKMPPLDEVNITRCSNAADSIQYDYRNSHMPEWNCSRFSSRVTTVLK